MNMRTPLRQVAFFLFFSCIVGFGSNLVRVDRIPWIAVRLSTVDSIEPDIETDTPILVAISLEQAKELYDENVLFIDARDEGYYSAGHIKNALKNAFLMELVMSIEERQNKGTSLVVYCGDPGCGDSEDLAYNLQDLGFAKLYVFKGGWVEWSKAGYPSEMTQ